jgi:hypothetical protein
MSRITLAPNASGSGTLTVAAPNTNTDRTITLPDATGTVNISGLANEVPAGSVGSPSIYSTGDANTGVFFPAADTVAVTTGGSERMRVDSSGNVGIGTSSPGTKLDVAGTITARAVGGEGGEITFNNIGDASAGLVVDVSSADVGRIFQTRNNSTLQLGQLAGTGGIVTLYTAATERMRINTSGQLLVGTASAFDTVSFLTAQFYGGCATFQNTALASSQVSFFNTNGRVGFISTTGSATTYSTSSDYRLKENVQPMVGALDTIALLNPVTYNWKSDGSDGQGFIAHELQAVVPDCVTGEKDAVDAEGNPQYQGVDTSFLVATLVAAIQEQQQMIQALQADIAALKGV